MKLVLGIDGGGTATKLKAANLEGRLLLEMKGKSSNICSNSRETVASHLKDLLAETLCQLPSSSEIASICMGSAGVVSEDGQQFFQDLLYSLTKCPLITVKNDGYIALYAYPDIPDIVSVTAGTGSICLGKNKSNQSASCGGWGHLFSDAGSAYAIAVDALKYSYYAYDEMIPPTDLLPLFLKRLGCRTPEDMIMKLLSAPFGKEQIAGLAPLVSEAAEANDPLALKILKENASQLFKLCENVIHKLHLKDECFSIAFNGSVLQKSTYVINSLQDLLLAHYPSISFIKTALDASWGAVYLALKSVQESN